MKTILITGGCGFIGANAANHYLKKGYRVIILDNLYRIGSKQNLKWLKTLRGKPIFEKIDVRNFRKLLKTFNKYQPDLILHLAAQTTVVASIANPRDDFEINALGTLNVLEAMKKASPLASLIYSSTNKVMGELADLPVLKNETRYSFKSIDSVSEKQPLNFQSPYGCSKGCGDQYVIDYSKTYNLNTVVFRQSCVYGPHQFGIEDQGWLAWFAVSLIFNRPVTIYGDGKQVRDVLYVGDLLKAFDLAFKNIKRTKGKAYLIGGGSNFTLSIKESFELLNKIAGKKVNYKFGPWRSADQKAYISDISLAKKDFSWFPRVAPLKGVKMLYDWLLDNQSLIAKTEEF